jgi:VWFA-related protein
VRLSTHVLRRRSSLFLAVATLGAAVGLGAAAPAQQSKQQAPFTEVVDVDLVNVDVVVVDKNGNLVTDLDRDDFTITDDGKKVEVGYFSRFGDTAAAEPASAAPPPDVPGAGDRSPAPGAGPRHLVIFVDLDNMTPHSRNRILGELGARLSESAGEGDALRVMIATFGPEGLDVELPFSPSPAEWAATLEEVVAMPGRGALRQAQQRRLVTSVERVLALAANKTSLQDARDQLDELMGSVRVESESVRTDALNTLRGVQTLASVLSIVPGQKSLLYVGDGVPIRPGQDLQDLLAEAFESDGRFRQTGGVAPTGANPGSSRPDDEPSAGVAEGGVEAVDSSDFVTPMAGSTETLRIDGMSADLTPELRALTATANSQRVTLYGLSTDAPGGTAGADFNAGARSSAAVIKTYDIARSQLFEASLQFMADETGGMALPPNGGVASFVDRMLSDHQNRYSLAYLSPHDGDSRFHKIKVKVNRKGVSLRHREGYIDRPRQVRIGDLVAGALLLGAGENPHHVEMELLSQEPAQNDEVAVAFALKIPLDQLHLTSAGDQHQTKLELYVLSKDGSGALAPMRYVEVTVSVPANRMAAAAGQFYGATLPLALKKGPQTVAIGIVEPAAQRTSVVRTEVEVGAGAG